MKTAIIILAAGKGTRMNSKRQKILHEVGGKPMVRHLYEAAVGASAETPIFVIGPGETGVQETLGDKGIYVIQQERLGTGHATMMAESQLKGKVDQVVVTYADMPLLQADTIRTLIDKQRRSKAAIVMMSVMGEPESTFGRIVRSPWGNVTEICEVAEAKQRDNVTELLAIRELNAGVYCFDADFLWSNIHDLPLRKARSGHEYYLTDMVEFAVKQKRLVDAIVTEDADECLGAGTRAELVAVEHAFRKRAVRKAHDAGVTIIDPEQTYIDQGITIGRDTVIWPGTYLLGDTTIGEDCVIGPNTIVRSSVIGDRCKVVQSVLEYVMLPDDMEVAPFTHVLPQEETTWEPT